MTEQERQLRITYWTQVVQIKTDKLNMILTLENKDADTKTDEQDAMLGLLEAQLNYDLLKMTKSEDDDRTKKMIAAISEALASPALKQQTPVLNGEAWTKLTTKLKEAIA
jgi:hypothetical protein